MISHLVLLDQKLFLRIGELRSAGVTRAMRALTHVGDATGWIAIGLFLIASSGSAARHGLLLGTAALLATIVSQALKRSCCRPRPSIGLPGFVAVVENPDRFSFPSGHSAAAVAVAARRSGDRARPALLRARLRDRHLARVPRSALPSRCSRRCGARRRMRTSGAPAGARLRLTAPG